MRRLFKTGLALVVTAGVLLLLGSALGQWIPGDRGTVGQVARSPGVVRSPGVERITVEVRNAGGVAGMARTATDHLRSGGFDVVALGNAASFGHERSVVIDRIGELETAQAVAAALGVDSVTSDPDPNLYVDVTVRLGSAWTAPREAGPANRIPLPAWLRAFGPDRKSRP